MSNGGKIKAEREVLMITPKTKVFDLFENWPQLEDVLIEYIPGLVKLKNPVLRKTVGKILSLEQAAAIGEVPLDDLLSRLISEGENINRES